MQIMLLGGPVMWPLLLISILALAVIVERAFVILPVRAPRGLTAGSSRTEILKMLEGAHESFGLFREAAAEARPDEIRLTAAGEDVVSKLDARLSLLAALSKTATLLGLLGTILGMIDTFAVVSETQSGIDMALLAQGLWQALITTAAGLIIAIPTSLALAYYQGRVRDVAHFLTLSGNLLLDAGRKPKGEAL